MDEIFEKIRKIVEMIGFQNAETTIDEEHKRISIIIEDRNTEEHVPLILSSLDHVFGLVFRKHNTAPFVLDINFYKKERERLITELARAAARKAIVTKNDVELPPMNGYERRLVHIEITTHPELKTESLGIGKERHVVIKRI